MSSYPMLCLGSSGQKVQLDFGLSKSIPHVYLRPRPLLLRPLLPVLIQGGAQRWLLHFGIELHLGDDLRVMDALPIEVIETLLVG